MLVLTRKQQQQIKIGDEITITILRMKGNTVRVGIEAPRTVRVVRGELPTQDAGEETSEMTIVEGVVRVTDDDETTEPSTTCEARPASQPISHLPQRRVLNRTGSAPLRVVMAGAVLAK